MGVQAEGKGGLRINGGTLEGFGFELSPQRRESANHREVLYYLRCSGAVVTSRRFLRSIGRQRHAMIESYLRI